MAFPKVGSLSPGFTLKNQEGLEISLDDFKNKKNVVLYFYPKASTPGCTTQACSIRDIQVELAELDIVVLGVSPDSPPKLQKFIEKYHLNFDLLADENRSVSEIYGVWGLKRFMGKEFMGILRTSFFIDKNGCLRYIMEKVNTKTHGRDVIAYFRDHILLTDLE